MSTSTDCICRDVPLRSPSGAMVRPRIHRYQQGNWLITEGQWIDPKLGQCFKRGIINREELMMPEPEEN